MPRNSLQCALRKARVGCLVRSFNSAILWRHRVRRHAYLSLAISMQKARCTRDKIALSTAPTPTFRSRTSSKLIARFLIFWAVSDKILQAGTVFPSTTATQRHRLGQPCAVSRKFVFGRGNHICQRQHTFNTVSCALFAGFFMQRCC